MLYFTDLERHASEGTIKYSHALFLNPYIERNATNTMMLFPPVGLEYVATSAKGLVDKLTLLDLRYEKDLADTDKLLDTDTDQQRIQSGNNTTKIL